MAILGQLLFPILCLWVLTSEADGRDLRGDKQHTSEDGQPIKIIYRIHNGDKNNAWNTNKNVNGNICNNQDGNCKQTGGTGIDGGTGGGIKDRKRKGGKGRGRLRMAASSPVMSPMKGCIGYDCIQPDNAPFSEGQYIVSDGYKFTNMPVPVQYKVEDGYQLSNMPGPVPTNLLSGDNSWGYEKMPEPQLPAALGHGDENPQIPVVLGYGDEMILIPEVIVYGGDEPQIPEVLVYGDGIPHIPDILGYVDEIPQIPVAPGYGDEKPQIPDSLGYGDKMPQLPDVLVYDGEEPQILEVIVYDDEDFQIPEVVEYGDEQPILEIVPYNGGGSPIHQGCDIRDMYRILQIYEPLASTINHSKHVYGALLAVCTLWKISIEGLDPVTN